MDTAKIGIIVPVYNAERYIRTCIESILNQTFQEFELILIDDGSTDASGKICDEYGAKSEKIKVIHSKHQGVSAIRNKGLKENRQEYVTFIDADDYIARRYLETLYRVMRKHKADLVISCGKTVNGYQEKEARNDSVSKSRMKSCVVTKSEAYQYMLTDRQVITSVWGKLYHRDVFQSVRYPEGEIYEDMKVIDKIIENSRRIAYTSYTGYFYVQTPKSITRGNPSLEHLALLKNERQLREFIDWKYPEISNDAKKHYFWSCFYVLSMLVLLPQYEKECRMLRSEIISEWKFLIFGRYTTIMEKAATLCLISGLPCYRFVWKRCQKLLRKRLV